MKIFFRKQMLRYLLVSFVLSIVLVSGQIGFAAETDGVIACDCQQKSCICYLQLGDKGGAMRAIITILKEKGYLHASNIKVTYTTHVQKAIESFQQEKGLDVNGLLNDATLSMLIYDMYPIVLNENEQKESFRVVWIPSNGGERYHEKSECPRSANLMIEPRKMTEYNAKGLGILPCKLCFDTAN